MRVIIATVQVPFIRGGAELHAENLHNNLLKNGIESEIVTFPFKFTPEIYIADLMEFIDKINFSNFGWVSIDKVIALRFPAYYVNHPNKVVWLLHQHRAVYDLYDPNKADENLKKLREIIIEHDNRNLSSCTVYANSQNVAKRLKFYNNIDSEPLYHPPYNAEKFYCSQSTLNYIFYPSRLEKLKRQDLVIRAMKYIKSDTKLIIAGIGGMYAEYQKLVYELNLHSKVSLIGEISEEEKFAFYANSLAVSYIPYDEDYGYVTLEAMLSSKPVITCKDSGGPLEFIIDGENGFIVEPNPKEIAEKIDYLAYNRKKSIEMGRCGREIYHKKNISWGNVINKLLN